ncbi:hypothetical protein BDZ89DRAFT_1154313 [Hymenopellis radicata]|nr:hypothetical protein BDZ89DRAFT_1154313 [Hymenopellis radicata]
MSAPAPTIVDIPSELLTEIFRLALGNRHCRCDTRTNIQLVCRRWRRVMLDSKSLWSQIVIDVKDLADETPPWSSIPSQFCGPDVSYISQCVVITHGHPLDIIIRVDVPKHFRYDTLFSLHEALSVLQLHSIRWRSFFCSGPSWVFNKGVIESFIDRDDLPQLERLSLVVNADSGQDLAHLLSAKIELSESLRHLNLNFPFPLFDVAWANITSFVGGFDDHTHFFQVLSGMAALQTLHLTHIQPLGAEVPQRKLTLEALNHLKLSKCALSAISSIADNLWLPALQKFSLLKTETHHHHLTKACAVEAIIPKMADSLCCMLKRSGATVGVLDISIEPPIESPFLVQLCARLDASVYSLRVEFSADYKRPQIAAFLNQLTVRDKAKSLFPRLLELELVGVNPDYGREALFKCPGLERLVISRWEFGGKGSLTRLQKLRLRRVRFQGDEYDDQEPESDSLAMSSLALTLSKLRFEGLDVQWLDESLHRPYQDWVSGDVDVLEDARQYIPISV